MTQHHVTILKCLAIALLVKELEDLQHISFFVPNTQGNVGLVGLLGFQIIDESFNLVLHKAAGHTLSGNSFSGPITRRSMEFERRIKFTDNSMLSFLINKSQADSRNKIIPHDNTRIVDLIVDLTSVNINNHNFAVERARLAALRVFFLVRLVNNQKECRDPSKNSGALMFHERRKGRGAAHSLKHPSHSTQEPA